MIAIIIIITTKLIKIIYPVINPFINFLLFLNSLLIKKSKAKRPKNIANKIPRQ